MATRAQKVRLALFFLISGIVLTFFLLFTVGLHLLKKREYYLIEFSGISLGGLSDGAQVKYQGFKAGRVESISISPEDNTILVVEISVQPDMVGAIKTDTQARLHSQGLIGIKHIELMAGTREADVLPPGSTIPVGETFFSDFDQRAEILTDKIDRVLDNAILLTSKENSVQFNKMLHASGNLMENADHLLRENRAPIHQTFENMAQTTRSLAHAAATLQATMDSLHQMLTGTEAHNAIADLQAATHHMRRQIEGPLPELIARMDKATANIDRTFTHIDRTVVSSRQNILDALQELEETLQNVREATELIREDPSILIRGREKE